MLKRKISNEEFNIANGLLELYHTHNYQLVTNLTNQQIYEKLLQFKIKHSFALGRANNNTFILMKITKMEIQLIKIIINNNNILFVPHTFTEPTYQIINCLFTEFNEPMNYTDLELCDFSMYLKNIFNLIKNDISSKNINFDHLYNDITIIINEKKKNNQSIYDLDKILNNICSSPILFQIIINKINNYNHLDYNTILLLNFGLTNIKCNDDISTKINLYNQLLRCIINMLDLNIKENAYNLIFLKLLNDILSVFNNNNLYYDKSLIKTKTAFLLNILNQNKLMAMFYPNILQIIC